MSDDYEFRSAMMNFIAHDFEKTKDNICLIRAIEQADFYGFNELKEEVVEVLKEKLQPKGKKLETHFRKSIWPSMFTQEMHSNGGNAEAAYRKIAARSGVTPDAVRKFMKRLAKKKS